MVESRNRSMILRNVDAALRSGAQGSQFLADAAAPCAIPAALLF